jgi:hypothetical protein
MYKLASVLVSIPVAKLTQKAVTVAWRNLRPGDPQTDANNPQAKWSDAAGFAALTAAGAALATVLTRRATDTAYKSATRMDPPPPRPTRAEKKRRKAETAAAAKLTKQPAGTD